MPHSCSGCSIRGTIALGVRRLFHGCRWGKGTPQGLRLGPSRKLGQSCGLGLTETQWGVPGGWVSPPPLQQAGCPLCPVSVQERLEPSELLATAVRSLLMILCLVSYFPNPQPFPALPGVLAIMAVPWGRAWGAWAPPCGRIPLRVPWECGREPQPQTAPSLPGGGSLMDQCHLSFWREEREVPHSESGLGPGLPSPPPRHRLEDGGVSGVTTSGQQSGGFPFSPR